MPLFISAIQSCGTRDIGLKSVLSSTYSINHLFIWTQKPLLLFNSYDVLVDEKLYDDSNLFSRIL